MDNLPASLQPTQQQGQAVTLWREVPEIIASAGPDARLRTAEFFTVKIRNRNTRMAYDRAVRHFLGWCKAIGVSQFSQVSPMVVSAWVESMGDKAAPSSKQRLAAVRKLFNHLVVNSVIPFNPASCVKGEPYSTQRGKTPVLDAAEVGQLLGSIKGDSTVEARDRALIALMTYTFARVSAAIGMTVGDIIYERNRMWVRLHEKGGKFHAMPCHHRLEEYLDVYIKKAGLQDHPRRPLFCTAARDGSLTDRPLKRIKALAMVKRRAKAAGLKSPVVNHSFRGSGITIFLENGGTVERAQQMANHASPRTTKLYDRRHDQTTMDDVDLIRVKY